MCTLSWRPLDNGYVLFFNRDESRQRAAALGPSLQQKNAVSFLSPTDATRGGTWLLVNEYGLSIGLLNNYAAVQEDTETDFLSRGMLPLSCADCDSVEAAIERVENIHLPDFPPFHLLVADSNQASLLSWDGNQHVTTRAATSGLMLTTSAFRPGLVARVRHETFANIVGDMAGATPARLKEFHWHAAGDGATSVRMSRPDSCTHNISQITVALDEAQVHFQYSPQAEISPAGKPVSCHLQLSPRAAAR